MNMQVSQDVFDAADAHPLARIVSQERPVKNRIYATLVTIVAHLIVIAGLVGGLHQVQVVHQPAEINLQIEPDKKDLNDPPPPHAPVLPEPTVVTVPIPELDIAAPPSPIVAAPATPAPPPVAASTPSTSTTNPNAAPTWQGLILSCINQALRYPADALFHNQRGIAYIRVTIDRDGNVLTEKIDKSSGHDLLDQEALAVLLRLQPLPKPPAEVPGNPIELIIPIEFSQKTHR